MRILENFMVNIRSLENLKTLSYKFLRRGGGNGLGAGNFEGD